MKDWDTDKFYTKWLRQEAAYGTAFVVLAVLNAVMIALDVIIHNPLNVVINGVVVIYGSIRAYDCLVTEPVKIRRRWADMKRLEAERDELTRRLDR